MQIRSEQTIKRRAGVAIACLLVSLELVATVAAACDPSADCTQCEAEDPVTGACTDRGQSQACLARRTSCRACVADKAARSGVSYQCMNCLAGAGGGDRSVTLACVGVCGGAAVLEKGMGAHVEKCE